MQRIEVKAPTVAEARPYGLFSHITWLDELEGEIGKPKATAARWNSAGISWNSRASDLSSPDPMIRTWSQGVDTTKSVSRRGERMQTDPVTFYRYLQASAGSDTFDELSAEVREDWDRNIERYVEQNFYGSATVQGISSYTNSTVVTSGAANTWPNLAGAIALLEKAWSEVSGTRPTLYIPFFAAYYVDQCAGTGFLTDVGGKLYTKFGTPVVLGSGFANTNKAGTDMETVSAGSIAIHAAGAPFGLRSELKAPRSSTADLTLDTDTVSALIEQSYITGWEFNADFVAYAHIC